MFNQAAHRHDNGFERQAIRAAQKLSYGQQVKNPWLLACAEIILREWTPEASPMRPTKAYVGPHAPGRPR